MDWLLILMTVGTLLVGTYGVRAIVRDVRERRWQWVIVGTVATLFGTALLGLTIYTLWQISTRL